MQHCLNSIRTAAGTDFDVKRVGFAASPACGLQLTHITCGHATCNAQDVELRFCPFCRKYLADAKAVRS